MRAAVRKAKVKPAVLPVVQPGASLPDLSQEQMNLFAEWLKSGSNGEQLTMISTDEPFEPDLAHAAEGFSMLQPCAFCLVIHTPNNLWCARSMGMPAESPLPVMSGGCGLNKCDNGFCACDMRAYEKEFEARVRARVELYSSQLEQHDSLMRRAATELVDRAVGIALNAIHSDNPCISACTPSNDPSVNVYTLDPAEQLLTTEVLDDTLAWPIEQVVTELSQAAQIRLPELEWQQLTGEKVFLPEPGLGDGRREALPQLGGVTYRLLTSPVHWRSAPIQGTMIC